LRLQGVTWREIGRELGVGVGTLYRIGLQRSEQSE
jgi:hypothetical protein